jgi:ketosteroid isomerase-like protein
MSRENVARQPVRLRERHRRTLAERLSVRMPLLVRLAGSAVTRLSPQSRLRRAMVRLRVRQGYEAVNRGDMEVAFIGSHPEVEWHMAKDEAGLAFDFEDVYRGYQGLLAWSERWWAAWDDVRLDSAEVIDCGDKLVVLLNARVRGRGSGVEVERPFAQVTTLRDGMAVRIENFWDHANALEAAGLSG